MQPLSTDLPGTPPIESPEFWKQPFRVEASSDPDTATAQTIGIMCGHVRAAASDVGVRMLARNAVGQFGRLNGARPGAVPAPHNPIPTTSEAIAASAWWWCKVYVKFTHHESLLRGRLGEAGHLQGLISPEVLVRMQRPEGDCAIFSECVAAFLTVFGVPFEFVTIAANPQEPSIYTHVYLYAVLPDGSRLPLDASHGAYPGWQVPSAHITRLQVWDASGNRVEDRGSRFDGLHNYGMRSQQGLGVMTCDEVGNCYDDGLPDAGAFPSGAGQQPASASSDTMTPWGTPAPGGVWTAPSQNSAQWASFATSLAKMGFTQAAISSIQPGTVVGKDGSILRQNPGYAVGSPTGALNVGTALGGNTILYIGLAAVAGLMLFSMKGGR